MRVFQFLFLAAAWMALTGCGNANDGLTRKYPSMLSAVTTTRGPSAPLNSFSSCKPFAVLGGSNPAYAQATFAGIQACRGVSHPFEVLLQVNSNFPTSTSFCLVPLTSSGVQAAQETCFNVNGQAQLQLNTSNYSYLVLLAQADLAAYRAYLAQQTEASPPRAVATMATL